MWSTISRNRKETRALCVNPSSVLLLISSLSSFSLIWVAGAYQTCVLMNNDEYLFSVNKQSAEGSRRDNRRDERGLSTSSMSTICSRKASRECSRPGSVPTNPKIPKWDLTGFSMKSSRQTYVLMNDDEYLFAINSLLKSSAEITVVMRWD